MFTSGNIHDILKEIHEGVCGGHFTPKVTSHRIIRVGYYWPSIFKDSYSFIIKCSACQKISRRMKRDSMPLQTILVDAPFMQSGLDVIGPINLKSSQGNSYILTATDYFMKWKEERDIKKVETNE